MTTLIECVENIKRMADDAAIAAVDCYGLTARQAEEAEQRHVAIMAGFDALDAAFDRVFAEVAK